MKSKLDLQVLFSEKKNTVTLPTERRFLILYESVEKDIKHLAFHVQNTWELLVISMRPNGSHILPRHLVLSTAEVLVIK